MRAFSWVSVLVCAAGWLLGCQRLEQAEGGSGSLGEPIFSSDEAGESCGTSRCRKSESCIERLCVPDLCFGVQEQRAPYGDVGILQNMSTLFVLDGSFGQSRFPTSEGLLSGPAPLEASYPISDVASGPVLFGNASSFLIGSRLTPQLEIRTLDAKPVFLPMPFLPLHVAVGDLDGEGLHETILGDGTSLALCDLAQESCNYDERIIAYHDLAVGDIDGDSLADVVLLSEGGVQLRLSATGELIQKKLERKYQELALVRRPGRPGDSLVLAHPERVDFFQWLNESAELVAEGGLSAGAQSIATTRTEAGQAALSLLLENTLTTYLQESASGAWVPLEPEVFASAEARLLVGDLPGASVLVQLAGKERRNGTLTPRHLLVHPPYWRGYQEPGEVSAGHEEDRGSSSKEYSSTGVSSTLGHETKQSAGVGAKVEVEGFGAFLGTTMTYGVYENWKSTSVNATESYSSSKRQTVEVIRQQYMVVPQEELAGKMPAHVLVQGACSDNYAYQIIDRKGAVTELIGTSLLMSFPQTSLEELMDIEKYNAIVERIGGFAIQLPHIAGDPTSYFDAALNLAGEPISDEDFFFRPEVTYLVQEGAEVYWRRDFKETDYEEVGEKTRNSTSTVTSDGNYFSTKVEAGMKVELPAKVKLKAVAVLEGKRSWGDIEGEGESEVKSDSITTFHGTKEHYTGIIEPLHDDPSTPEDEFAQLRFSFAPYIYEYRLQAEDGRSVELLVTDYKVGNLQ